MAIIENNSQALVAGADAKAIVPQTMEDAFRIATAVVKAGMAPPGLDTQEKCLVAIMQGLEVGMTPMQSVQRIAVINGRPTIWGDAAIGLVRGSGLCEYIKEWIEGDGEEMIAYCEAMRKGESEPITGSFSVADAKDAGLWEKKGPWTTYRKRMLQMRSRGFVLRDGFADVLGGMYLKEEIDEPNGNREIKDITPSSPTDSLIPPDPDQVIEDIEPEQSAPDGHETQAEPEIEHVDWEKHKEDLIGQMATADSPDILAEIHDQHNRDEAPDDVNTDILEAYHEHAIRISKATKKSEAA